MRSESHPTQHEEGLLSVIRRNQSPKRHTAMLKIPMYFDFYLDLDLNESEHFPTLKERALLFDEPRSATVQAAGPSWGQRSLKICEKSSGYQSSRLTLTS